MNSKNFSSKAWSRSVVLCALPGTFTALCAFSVFVLVLGLAVAPAQAHPCNREVGTHHKHCNTGPPNDAPEGATLNFGRQSSTDDAEGGIDYPDDDQNTTPLPPFPVRVGTDSSKKIQIGNSEFDIFDAGNTHNDGIMMDFDITPGFYPPAPAEAECWARNAAALEDTDAEVLEAMGQELNSADITSGFFETNIDRRSDTGGLGFQYTSDNGLLSELGQTRIHLGGGLGSPTTPVVVEENDTFSFFGGHAVVRQLTAGGAMSHPIIVCTVIDDFNPSNPTASPPAAVLILNR